VVYIGILWNGTDLFQQCEWGGDRAKHTIADSGLKLNGQTLTQADRAPVDTTSGFLYSGETFTPTGLKLKGTQVVLQKPGCWPSVHGAQLYHQTSVGTYYINRFTDGEVWVSTAANSRSGTIICNSLAGTASPRGIRYLMLRIVGGGGKGANGALIPVQVGGGGGGGATAYCCVKLPVNGYATVVVGGENAFSKITCGTFSCTAGAGQTLDDRGGAGGSVYGGDSTADGILFASASGGAGGDKYKGGGSSFVSVVDHGPAGAAFAYGQPGGDSGSGTGGGGGASALGQGGKTANGSLNTNGSMGNGPGAGGSGGNYSSGKGGGGQPGTLTIWY